MPRRPPTDRQLLRQGNNAPVHTPRPNASRRGYDYQWQQASKQYLSIRPLCTYCQQEGRTMAAEVVDHIIPHRGDMALFWDVNNWQPLCQYHHHKKTAAGQ